MQFCRIEQTGDVLTQVLKLSCCSAVIVSWAAGRSSTSLVLLPGTQHMHEPRI